MNRNKLKPIPAALFCLLMGGSGVTMAEALIQCPNDLSRNPVTHAVSPAGQEPDGVMNDSDVLAVAGTEANFPNLNGNVGDIDFNGDGILQTFENTKCMHLSGSEGFITMADGYAQFMFGFGELIDETTNLGIPQGQSLRAGIMNARMPSSKIVLEQGEEFFLTLTNAGFVQRPDLFDSHTIHYHGFPEVSGTYDGVPELSFSINPAASLTYYYNQTEPGTYMYHCHVEATEHMQMGMLGNLYVHALQDRTGVGGTIDLPDVATQSPRFGGTGPTGYVYNDGDGATAYDVEQPIQIHTFDPVFHDNSRNTQPLPFADMHDTYTMINGRGYPDTINPLALPAPSEENDGFGNPVFLNALYDAEGNKVRDEVQSQVESSLITATAGQKILLRISNLSVTGSRTLTILGLDMHVIGRGAKILRSNGETDLASPNIHDISYVTNTLDVGEGEGYDVLIDTAGVTSGTYYLYTSNLNFLSNNNEDFGGIMTTIVVN